MSDFDSAQPVRLNDGTNDFGFVIGTPFFVTIADAGGDQIEIDASGQLGVVIGSGPADIGKAEDSVHVTGDVGVGLLAVRQSVQADLAPDGDYTFPTIDDSGGLRVSIVAGSAGGASAVDDSVFTIGVDNVAPAGYLADETATDSVDEGDVGLARMTLDRKVLHVLVDPTTDANRAAIDANGSQQVLLFGSLDPTSVNADDNPIFVQVVTGATSSTEINDFNQAVGVAAMGGTATHALPVSAASTLLLRSVIFAGSGSGKVEIALGPLASEVTKAVAFISSANPTRQVFFDPPIELVFASDEQVLLTVTNRDNQAQDLYTTIIGDEI
jgi:hypothetical protein